MGKFVSTAIIACAVFSVQAFAQKKPTTSETVVNMVEAGITSSGSVMSCLFVRESISGGKSGMSYFQNFVPQLGVKYVLPIITDSTCIGRGLSASIYYSSRDLDIYLEDIATGTRIAINKPDGCWYSQSYGSREYPQTGFVSMLNPPNSQLVIRAKRQLSQIGDGTGNIGHLGFMVSQDEVNEACYYVSNWSWPGN